MVNFLPNTPVQGQIIIKLSMLIKLANGALAFYPFTFRKEYKGRLLIKAAKYFIIYN